MFVKLKKFSINGSNPKDLNRQFEMSFGSSITLMSRSCNTNLKACELALIWKF